MTSTHAPDKLHCQAAGVFIVPHGCCSSRQQQRRNPFSNLSSLILTHPLFSNSWPKKERRAEGWVWTWSQGCVWVTAGVYKSERWVASGLDPPWMLLSSVVCLSGFGCPSRPLQPWPTDTQVKVLRARERVTFELGGRPLRDQCCRR